MSQPCQVPEILREEKGGGITVNGGIMYSKMAKIKLL
jgi:hypothetical protein